MSVLGYVKELTSYRGLLWAWSLRDVKVRYKQTVLGIAWAILQPLATTAVFSLVFTTMVHVPSDDVPYPLFAFSAMLPWSFLTTSLTTGVPSISNNLNLVTKTYFPREILPLAAILASLVDFLIASVVFVVMVSLYRVPIGLTSVAVVALLTIEMCLVTSVVFVASALNVFYRDIRFVIPLAAQLWMYLSPVVYPVSVVPTRFQQIYMLNPMAVVIDGYRQALFADRWPDGAHVAFAALVSAVLLILSYRYFKSAEADFADLI